MKNKVEGTMAQSNGASGRTQDLLRCLCTRNICFYVAKVATALLMSVAAFEKSENG
jgi:hypothetical protein